MLAWLNSLSTPTYWLVVISSVLLGVGSPCVFLMWWSGNAFVCPQRQENESLIKFVSGLILGSLFWGFVVCVLLLFLCLPSLFYHKVLGWSMPNSLLAGVATSVIVPVVIADLFNDIRSKIQKFRNKRP